MVGRLVILFGVAVGLLGLGCGCDKAAPPAADVPAQSQKDKPSVDQAPASASQVPIGPPVPEPGQAAATELGPRWRCGESTFDFGEVWAGDTVRHNFEFTNVGDERLKVLEAKPRCSCSVAEHYTKEVAAGETGVIPFVLRTTNKPNGRLNEWLTIKTNDPVQPDMKIILTGIIRTVASTEVIYDAIHERDTASGLTNKPLNKKAKLSFGRIKADDRLRRVLKLRNTSGQPLTLFMIPPPEGSPFKAELRVTVPGEEFELTVTGEPPYPVGRPAATAPIRFRTNIPQKPFYHLAAYAYVPPPVEVQPEKIVITSKQYSSTTRTIRITNNAGGPLEILSISRSDPVIGIVLEPTNPIKPNETLIKVTFPESGYDPPPHGELIQIKTNSAEKPLIEIAVLPHLRRPPGPRPADKPLELHPVPLPDR